jgi:hypothetical protein
MSYEHETDWSAKRREHVGDQFSSLGRIGLYVQLVLLAAPFLLGVYVLFFGRPAQPGMTRVDFGSYISLGSFLIMGFTAYWFYRYMQVGRKLRDPEHFPPRSSVITTLWVGFGAGWLGIVFSMLLLLAAAWRMMFVLILNPQSGLIIAPNPSSNPGYSVSAIDAISLTWLVISLAAELMVLGLTLWLLFKVTWPASPEIGEPAAVPAE